MTFSFHVSIHLHFQFFICYYYYYYILYLNFISINKNRWTRFDFNLGDGSRVRHLRLNTEHELMQRLYLNSGNEGRVRCLLVCFNITSVLPLNPPRKLNAPHARDLIQKSPAVSQWLFGRVTNKKNKLRNNLPRCKQNMATPPKRLYRDTGSPDPDGCGSRRAKKISIEGNIGEL